MTLLQAAELTGLGVSVVNAGLLFGIFYRMGQLGALVAANRDRIKNLEGRLTNGNASRSDGIGAAEKRLSST